MADANEGNLEVRIQKIEDILQITQLKSAYCYRVNVSPGSPGELGKFASLFAEDATYDTGFGVATGPRDIETSMFSRRTAPEYAELVVSATHVAVNPRIEIDGDRASGTWTGLCPVMLRDNTQPVWYCVIYDETYVRTRAGWRFQSIALRPAFHPREFKLSDQAK